MTLREIVAKADNATDEELIYSLRAASDAADGTASTALRDVLKPADGKPKLTIHHASALAEQAKEEIVALFTANMRTLYEASSFGFNIEEKREELFDPSSRFLLLRQTDSGKLLTFAMFRFDAEATAKAGVQTSVLYCYEVQIDSATQGAGLGRLLMHAMETITKAYNMHKAMLTVFKANSPALAFYRKLGYENDEICPSRGTSKEDAQADYEILSKVASPKAAPVPRKIVPVKGKMIGGRRR